MAKFWIQEEKYSNYNLLYSQCNSQINLDEKNTILIDLQSGLTDYDVFEYFNAQPTIFKDYDHLVIARDLNNKTIGLIGAKCFMSKSFKFLYFWSAMIGKQFHGTPLIFNMYRSLLKNAFLKEGFLNVIATKTYNPLVYNIFRKSKKVMKEKMEIYPSLEKESATKPIMKNYALDVFNTICPSLELEIDTARVIGGQGVLSPNFFPKKLPDSKESYIDDHFRKHLTRDDQILCVAYIPNDYENEFKDLLKIK